MNRRSRLAAFGRSLALLLFACTAAMASSGLPKLAVTGTACGGVAKVIVLPATTFEWGRTAGVAQTAPQSAPLGQDIYAHLTMAGADMAQGGTTVEAAVNERVAANIARLPLKSAGVRGLLIEVAEATPATDLLRFTLATVAVSARVENPDLKVAYLFPVEFLDANGDFVKKLAIYADMMGTLFTSRWLDHLGWFTQEALNKPVFMKLAPAAPEQVAPAYLDAALAASGTSVDILWVDAPGEDAGRPLCAVSSLLARFVTDDFSKVDSSASPVSVTVDGQSAGYQIFNDALSPSVAVVAEVGATPDAPKRVSLLGPGRDGVHVEWYDLLTAQQLKGVPTSEADTLETSTCPSQYVLIYIRKKTEAAEQPFVTVGVTGNANLTAEEIIARWQGYRESQRRLLSNYVASCFLTLHFQPTGLGSGFDISMRLKQFWSSDGPTEWAQTEFFVNGVRFGGKTQFPLPQLQPEKVLTQPLVLKMTEKYSYRLLGTDRVDGALCFLIGLDPKDQSEALYSGRIWIDGTSFRQVKMELHQSGSQGSVVSNVETQSFHPVPDGKGNEINLIDTIYAQQLLNAAGRNFLLEKTYEFSSYELNTPGFGTALAASRLSDSPMFRDTDAGLRTLKKEGNERVVQDLNQKRIKSILAGTMYDGNFAYPIPLFGLSMVDFDFRNSGSQLSVFFAGPFLAANLSRQYSKTARIGFDLALSALPSKNRVFSGNREILNEAVSSYEQTTGVRFTWQPTGSLSLTAATYLSFDFYRATDDTSKQYVLPHNGLALSPTLELKWTHKGYDLAAAASRTTRFGWKEFGAVPGEAVQRDFIKYNAIFSKSFFVGKFTKLSLGLAYFGGDKLDRFSRYLPSFLSQPRVRGIPAGTDSFDRIGVAGVSYGFSVMDFIRFEGAYNHAEGKNLAESRGYEKFDGAEFDFGTAGPWGTYMQGIVTYAIRGNLERYRSRWGAYLLMFKPL